MTLQALAARVERLDALGRVLAGVEEARVVPARAQRRLEEVRAG
jgi:hypothetical protein